MDRSQRNGSRQAALARPLNWKGTIKPYGDVRFALPEGIGVGGIEPALGAWTMRAKLKMMECRPLSVNAKGST